MTKQYEHTMNIPFDIQDFERDINDNLVIKVPSKIDDELHEKIGAIIAHLDIKTVTERHLLYDQILDSIYDYQITSFITSKRIR